MHPVHENYPFAASNAAFPPQPAFNIYPPQQAGGVVIVDQPTFHSPPWAQIVQVPAGGEDAVTRPAPLGLPAQPSDPSPKQGENGHGGTPGENGGTPAKHGPPLPVKVIQPHPLSDQSESFSRQEMPISCAFFCASSLCLRWCTPSIAHTIVQNQGDTARLHTAPP